MSLYDFILLDATRQAEAIWEGEFVTFREEPAMMGMLYRVYSFYVEVYYSKEDNAIVRFNPFRSKLRLGLYLRPPELNTLPIE